MENKNLKNRFWVVMGKLPTRVTVAHAYEDAAIREARRLARANPGEEFTVMESVSSFVVNNLIEYKFVKPEDNPEDDRYIPF